MPGTSATAASVSETQLGPVPATPTCAAHQDMYDTDTELLRPITFPEWKQAPATTPAA